MNDDKLTAYGKLYKAKMDAMFSSVFAPALVEARCRGSLEVVYAPELANTCMGRMGGASVMRPSLEQAHAHMDTAEFVAWEDQLWDDAKAKSALIDCLRSRVEALSC